MTKEELAKQIDGIEYPAEEIRTEFAKVARDAGLVIAYGQSDDLLEFEGAIRDEVGAYDSHTEPLNANGLITHECDDEDCPHERRIKEAAKNWVKAERCPDDAPVSWRITASVPVASFNIMEDGEVYCQCIVFAFADLDSLTVPTVDKGEGE